MLKRLCLFAEKTLHRAAYTPVKRGRKLTPATLLFQAGFVSRYRLPVDANKRSFIANKTFLLRCDVMLTSHSSLALSNLPVHNQTEHFTDYMS